LRTSFTNEIDLIRKTASSLLVFHHERRTSEQWSKFCGCIDTLKDMDNALQELLNIKRKSTMAECIGFLQILFSQQEAIKNFSESVGLTWNPFDNPVLGKIRDIRNRVTHSAWAELGKDGPSTSILNHYDIRVGGFEVVIYRDKDSERFPLNEDIDFVEYVDKNISNLIPQISNILDAMNDLELGLKGKMKKLDWSFLNNDADTYLNEKLWSPWKHSNAKLLQAKRHMQIFLKRLNKAKDFFADNQIYEINNYNIDALIAGSIKLLNYLSNEFPSEEEKFEYYVMLVGWTELWERFDDEIVSLKDKIGVI